MGLVTYMKSVFTLTNIRKKVRDQLASKFGKEFMLDAMEDKNGFVNQKVSKKLHNKKFYAYK